VKNREERRIRNMSQEELRTLIGEFLDSHAIDVEYHNYIHTIWERLHEEDISYQERKTVLDLMERLHRDPTTRSVRTERKDARME